MLLHLLTTVAIAAFASAHCIFSDTECVCTQKPSNSLCLRYYSGVNPSTTCEAYTCGTGYTCDCSGTEMCDIKPCSKQVYRPTSGLPGSVGSVVSCTEETKNQCIELRAGGGFHNSSPTPSPSPSESEHAHESESPSSSTTPSPSESEHDHAHKTESPSPSTSPYVSVIPSPSQSEHAHGTESPSPSASS